MVSAGPHSVPLITLEGTADECGSQYGATVAGMVRSTVEMYLKVFHEQHGFTQAEVFELARRFEPVIEAYDEGLLAEMRGIARGAEVPLETIIAINARSELVHGLKAQLEGGCTSFAALGPATKDGHVVIGQNWDWSPDIRKSTVLLDIRRDGEPQLLTVTEAGLVGKIGINETGIGLVVNFLLSDTRRFGTPVHVIRRKILSSWNLGEALGAVLKTDRALAANYLVAHAGGEALSLEAWPGDVEIRHPEDGILTHANHFVAVSGERRDLGKEIFPDSLLRDRRLKVRLAEAAGEIDVEAGANALRDHFNAPEGICRHLNPRLPAKGQIETLGSVVCDLNERMLYFCSGPPCEGSFTPIPLDRRRKIDHPGRRGPNQRAASKSTTAAAGLRERPG
jgi:isopenicillin-N N-acyltransferase-like protein